MSEEATLDEFAEQGGDDDVSDEHPRFGSLPDDWKISEIADVAEVVGGSTPSTGNEDYWSGGIPWATPTDITTLSGNTISETEDTITEEGLKSTSTHLLPPKSVLMTSRATIGKCAINTVEMATNQGFKNLVTSDEIEPWYLYYRMLDTAAFLNSLGSGSTFDEVSKTEVQSVEIPISPLPEQRKIATLLYTVDRAIEKTEEIREKAKEVEEVSKTEFFTRGYSERELDESVGWRCRANTFPKDWRVEPAEELMDITRGASPRPRSDDSLFGGEIPWIKIGDANRGISKRIDEVDSYVTEKGKQKSKFVEEGTLLVANSGATCGFSVFAGIDGCVHDGWLILREHDDFVLDFLYHYINWNYDYLQSLSLGSAQTNLSTGLFGRLDIPIPPIQEQRQIAEALDSINRVASHASKEVDRLQRLKRGLMQDLLSGTVRTTDTNIQVPDEIKQYG